MTMENATPLKWSAQFSILPGLKTPPLRGDKIILPPSALEQLLSAATTLAPRDSSTRSDFDPYNPYSVAAERQARSEIVERQQDLPHPLTFRLVNPKNGRILYAGVREFSAEEDHVGVSPFLGDALGFTPGNDRGEGKERLTVHVAEIPKGTYVKLRPLEAGYDVEDWKALLERYLRDNFTTLTNGEVLTVSVGKETYRFLVDELKPSDEAVSLVDTDLEVDIEPLNEEQARETLRKQLQKSQKAPGTPEGSSAGGIVSVDNKIFNQVMPGEYVDYTLEKWDRSKELELELEAVDDKYDVDVFVSPFSSRQRLRPREEEHVLADFSGQPSKKIKIRHTNAALDNAEALWVSIRGQTSGDDQRSPIQYHLQIISSEDTFRTENTDQPEVVDGPPNPDDTRCKNCQQWVPQRTLFLHENFCLRNNSLCPHCSNVFQKSSALWKDHWHCAHDDAYGSTLLSHTKHDSIFHTAQKCQECGYRASNVPDLAHHRTTICPTKPILCRFCHLQVPQQGPEDPNPSDPEVMLSGLTPHELSDGARTTECHLCSKIIRLRDMSTHLKHHDLQRLSRIKPMICRNANCGRTLDTVSKGGDVRLRGSQNDIGVCDTCFGPLYANTYDPDGKALKRRVERKYLSQLLTGCGQTFCRNAYCKSGRKNSNQFENEGKISSKEATAMIKPTLENLRNGTIPLYFCTDEASQGRRAIAEMAALTGLDKQSGGSYEVEWIVAALEIEAGDWDRAQQWLKDCAPTRSEAR